MMMDKRQLDLLLQILQAVHDSDAEEQVVYPLLEEHLDELDENFAQVLRDWAITTLPNLDLVQAQGTVAAVFSFSDLLLEFPFGEQALHLEIAIAGYEAVMIVATPEAFPQEWAITQTSLGNTYADRIYGNRTENLETAIRCYRESLKINTREANSEQWATIQENLGNVYGDRIKGEPSDNLETAIKHYSNALEVFTREAFSKQWARINKNLGLVYLTRIEGKRVDNLEVTLRCYLEALKIYTYESFPEKWAELQNNLGYVYQQRIRGEETVNLEAAINSYKSALQVYTQQDFPTLWAIAKINLGGVYRRRLRGQTQQNLELAIESYRAALAVCSKETEPIQWSMVQNNLGSLYYDYEQDPTGDNFEIAISYFLRALEVRTREATPERWAEVQNNLGLIYLDRIQGDKSENIEASIQHYFAALEVYTYEDFPEAWADTQDNLGISYRLRIKGDRSKNLEQSIQCHLQPLTVYTRDAYPQNWMIAQNNLGIAYQDAGRFQAAYTAFENAINVLETLRDEITTGFNQGRDKQKLAERWNILYQRMVEVCLELKRRDWALIYVEHSKTRNLVEMILQRENSNLFPPDAISKLKLLQTEIFSSQRQLQKGLAKEPSILARQLQKLRQERNHIQDLYLPVGSGFSFEQVQDILDEQTVIMQWYLTRQGFYTFVITSFEPQPFVISHTAVELEELENWSQTYWQLYYQKDNQVWRDTLPSLLQRLSKLLDLENVLAQLSKTYHQLILIPHRFLHLLPLHILPLEQETSNGSLTGCLLDLFSLGVLYAPSCQLFQLVQYRHHSEFNNLLAIKNPTDNLSYTEIEVEAIQGYFKSAQILKQNDATKKAFYHQLQDTVHCLHFSCHGSFDLTNPFDSSLQLADELLTLDEIFALNLSHTSLVTLSACETGLTDPTSVSDEYIGLPSGFLYAGSSNVISSLWAVNDVSSALLMDKFYENLQRYDSMATALNQAQAWLRDAKGSELKQWLATKQLSLEPTLRINLNRRFSQKQPFKSPYYWAAFCIAGK